MRRIVAFDRLSADGYFSTPDGGLGWAVPDADLDRLAADATSGPENTILFGRRTYDMFESFWPHVVKDDPDAPDPHAPHRRSPELRAMGVWINEATKIVFSRTRHTATWKGSRLVRDLDPDAVRAMKQETGRDMMIFGSGSIVSALTAHGLVDEYQLVVGPVLLGDGRSLVNGLVSPTRLELLEARPYSSGNVMLRYAPLR
jgi:dihydrofolate reductase